MLYEATELFVSKCIRLTSISAGSKNLVTRFPLVCSSHAYSGHYPALEYINMVSSPQFSHQQPTLQHFSQDSFINQLYHNVKPRTGRRSSPRRPASLCEKRSETADKHEPREAKQ